LDDVNIVFAFIKCLSCVERVRTDTGEDPFLAEEEEPADPEGSVSYVGGSICENSAVLFTFGKNYGIIQLIDKLEFDEGV